MSLSEPIAKMVCDRNEFGSYSVAIAHQRLEGGLSPSLAPVVVLLNRLWVAQSGVSSHSGDVLRK